VTPENYILSPHCTLRYDAACRATHSYANAVRVVLFRCSVVTGHNDGASLANSFTNRIFGILDLGVKTHRASGCPRNVLVHFFLKDRHSLTHVDTHAFLTKVDGLKTLPHLIRSDANIWLTDWADYLYYCWGPL